MFADQNGSRGGGYAVQIGARRHEKVTIFDLSGDVDFASSRQLRHSVLREIQENRTPQVVVNLSAVRYIDGFGLASLVEAVRARRWNLPTPAESPNPWVKRFDYCSDVAVLENPISAVSSLDGDVHHGACQVVGTNHLVRKQQLKHGVDGAQKAIAEIRFLPRLHGVDVCGPEEVNARESGREECVLGLSLVSRESDPASSGRIRAVSAQE